jgi:hypothetical protein
LKPLRTKISPSKIIGTMVSLFFVVFIIYLILSPKHKDEDALTINYSIEFPNLGKPKFTFTVESTIKTYQVLRANIDFFTGVSLPYCAENEKTGAKGLSNEERLNSVK